MSFIQPLRHQVLRQWSLIPVQVNTQATMGKFLTTFQIVAAMPSIVAESDRHQPLAQMLCDILIGTQRTLYSVQNDRTQF